MNAPPQPARRDAIRALAGAVLLPVLGPARGAVVTPVVERRALFGGPVELLYADDATTARAWAAQAWAGLEAISTRWNAWKPGEVQVLNRAFRDGRDAPLSPLLEQVLRMSRRAERASRGCFNAAIGAEVAAWGFHADVLADGPAPQEGRLERWRRSRPSLDALELRGGRVASRDPAVQLDLGAIGKGFAIDRALDGAQGAGVDRALVDLGGNLAALAPAGGPGWQIGIRDPFADGLVARIETQGREAVVTSGTYERWRRADGRRITHILDPRTAAPAPALVSVTVVHAPATWADAVATALLVAGPSGWPVVAARMGVVLVLVVDRDGRATATPAMHRRLRPLGDWRIGLATG